MCSMVSYPSPRKEWIILVVWHGYMGKILDVDLSSGTTTVLDLDKDLAESYLGGKGFGARILFDQ